MISISLHITLQLTRLTQSHTLRCTCGIIVLDGRWGRGVGVIMATNEREIGKIVLHVRPIRAFAHHEGNTGEQIDIQLQQAGLNVELCTDVYRALARLNKNNKFENSADQSYQAVVVCVDGLSSSEFEFFTIVAKHAYKTPVFVYSNMDRADQLATAREAGASGLFVDDTLTKLAADSTVEPANSGLQTPTSFSEVIAPATQPPTESQIAQDSTESLTLTLHSEESGEADPGTSMADDSGEELTNPIQVPWKARREGSVRMPPSRSRDDVKMAAAESPPNAKEDADVPLLTEDELRALLDEDVASWPPPEWGEPDTANPNSGAELS